MYNTMINIIGVNNIRVNIIINHINIIINIVGVNNIGVNINTTINNINTTGVCGPCSVAAGGGTYL